MTVISLSGKVACITGASRGIGRGIALALAREGCRIGICSRKEADIEQCKKEIEKIGVPVICCVVDVSKKEDMILFKDAVMNAFGTIDIWVNNAGYMPINLLENANMDEWDRTVDVNCKGVLHGIGCCLPIMKANNSGHIINISSDGGLRQFDCITVYCATKYFVEGLSIGLRREIKGYNIKVTNIQPGDVGTDLGMESTDKEAIRRYYGSERDEDECEDDEEEYESDTEDDSILDVENIADTVLYISFPCLLLVIFIERLETTTQCWSKFHSNRTLEISFVYCFRFPIVIRRFASTVAKEGAPVEEAVKTTVDTGKQLEERVARMLRKRGHINIKMNQRIKDKNGNWSEFDIVYGWPIRHYVECKNYSHPVKLEMVAKFKEVLRLHHIPRSRGLFVTTSTYTPRATTIGITCVDGAGLERLEKTATTALLMKYLIILVCGGASYGLYYFLCNSEMKSVKKWRDGIDSKNQQLVKQSKQAVKEASNTVVEVASDTVEKVSDVVVVVKKNIEEVIKQDNLKKEEEEEEEEWEAPSLWECVSAVFWGILGYSQ